MNNQRLRNLTTGRLHTEMGHIYEDLGAIIGQDGLMTQMLPSALDAVKPWLEEHVTDKRFWNGEYDISHEGEYELPDPTDDDRAAMFKRYFERYKVMPNPLEGKKVVGVRMPAPANQSK